MAIVPRIESRASLLVILFTFFVATAYGDRIAIPETPLIVTDQKQCERLSEAWDLIHSRLEAHHDQCLASSACKKSTGDPGECGCSACLAIHRQRDDLSRQESESKALCQSRLRTSQDNERRRNGDAERVRQQAEAEQRKQQEAANQRREAQSPQSAPPPRTLEQPSRSVSDYVKRQEETRRQLARDQQEQKDRAAARARETNQIDAERDKRAQAVGEQLQALLRKLEKQEGTEQDMQEAKRLGEEAQRLAEEFQAEVAESKHLLEADADSPGDAEEDAAGGEAHDRIGPLAAADLPAFDALLRKGDKPGLPSSPPEARERSGADTRNDSMPAFDDLLRKAGSQYADQGAQAAVGAWDHTLLESIQSGEGWVATGEQLSAWMAYIRDRRSGDGDPLARATFVTQQSVDVLFVPAGAAGKVAGFAFTHASSTIQETFNDAWARLQTVLDAFDGKTDWSVVDRASDFNTLFGVIGTSMCPECGHTVRLEPVVRGTWNDLANLLRTGR